MWFNVEQTPELKEQDFGLFRSDDVLGYFPDGSMRVVHARRYDDCEYVEWVTSCSECWNVTGRFTNWCALPEKPE